MFHCHCHCHSVPLCFKSVFFCATVFQSVYFSYHFFHICVSSISLCFRSVLLYYCVSDLVYFVTTVFQIWFQQRAFSQVTLHSPNNAPPLIKKSILKRFPKLPSEITAFHKFRFTKAPTTTNILFIPIIQSRQVFLQSRICMLRIQKICLTRIHTSYLSFFLHEQNFWRVKFTPKYTVNYCVLLCITQQIHSKLPIFRVKSVKIYTGQFLAPQGALVVIAFLITPTSSSNIFS